MPRKKQRWSSEDPIVALKRRWDGSRLVALTNSRTVYSQCPNSSPIFLGLRRNMCYQGDVTAIAQP